MEDVTLKEIVFSGTFEEYDRLTGYVSENIMIKLQLEDTGVVTLGGGSLPLYRIYVVQGDSK